MMTPTRDVNLLKSEMQVAGQSFVYRGTKYIRKALIV